MGEELHDYNLAKHFIKTNKEFIIVEKDDKIGGRIYTHNFNGNEINLGAHVIKKIKNYY